MNNQSTGILFLFLLFASCTARTTDEDIEKNGKVRVILDWEAMRAGHPGVFDYYFYTEGSQTPLVRRGDASGYEGTLPQGRYAVAVCNPDGTNLSLSMQKGYAEARAVVHTDATSKASGTILQPSHLYGAGKEGIVATATASEPTVLYPACLTKEVQLNILIIGGAEITVASGELSGIPPEVCIPTGRPCAGYSSTVAFPVYTATGLNRYTALLSLFGLRPGNTGGEVADPTLLQLNMQLKNGQSFASRTDVTALIDEAVIDGHVTRIELDLEVQPLITGGYTLVVTGWRVGEAEADSDYPDPSTTK